MKSGRSWVVLAVAACSLVSFAGAALASADEPAAAVCGIGVDIAPDPEEDGTCGARAIVTDLKTEEVLSAPQIRFPCGPYEAEIRRGGILVFLHKVRIRLAAREKNE